MARNNPQIMVTRGALEGTLTYWGTPYEVNRPGTERLDKKPVISFPCCNKIILCSFDRDDLLYSIEIGDLPANG